MPKWVRKGECNHCGYCCVFAVNRTRLFIKEPNDRDREFLTTRGFKIAVTPMGVGLDIVAEAYVPCPMHKADRCIVYEKRPEACKLFPETPDQVMATPCSYWFEDEEGEQQPIGGDASPYSVKTEHYRNLLELKQKMVTLRTEADAK